MSNKTIQQKKSKSTKVTPLMKQYAEAKAKYPDAILLFRVGDFYETFGKDAITASKVLGIVLTSRNNGGSDIELAGFPYHSMDLYLPKLVRAGFRVAICEQMEKPSKEKKIVKRGVTEVLSPGMATLDQILDASSNNFVASLYYGRHRRMGVAFLDITTGEFFLSEGDAYHVEKLLQAFSPSEVLYARTRKSDFEDQFGDSFYSYLLEDWIYTEDYGRDLLQTLSM